eukprot:6561602-Heterocapsa_arctica.AAC.1
MKGWDGHCVRPAGGGPITPKPEGPKAERNGKRGPSEDPKELRERTEAEAAGKAMDMTTGGLAAALPGCMKQEESVGAMSLDHQQDGRPLDPAEVAEWNVSEAREEERKKSIARGKADKG